MWEIEITTNSLFVALSTPEYSALHRSVQREAERELSRKEVIL